MAAQSTVQIPRVAIRFCTQCKWNLRAAYYAQELLQTFSTSIGEISLIPVTGGIFTITLYHAVPAAPAPAPAPATVTPTSSSTTQISTASNPDSANDTANDTASTHRAPNQHNVPAIQETLIWDRKHDTGFPETKELKNRIRNIIDPDRDMGHIDRSLKKKQLPQKEVEQEEKGPRVDGGGGGDNEQGKSRRTGLSKGENVGVMKSADDHLNGQNGGTVGRDEVSTSSATKSGLNEQGIKNPTGLDNVQTKVGPVCEDCT